MPFRFFVIAATFILLASPVTKAYFAVGQEVVSPDGKIEAKLSDWWHLQLTDKFTGKLIFATLIKPPVFSIKWLGDSEAMLVTEHVSGGALAHLVRKSGASYDAYPQDQAGGVGSFRRIVEEKVNWNKAELTYKIGNQFRFWTCSFEVDDAGDISHLKRRDINENEYESLPALDQE